MMAIPQTHCAICRDCDWKAVWRGSDVIMFPRLHCPRCGGALDLGLARGADRWNPVYRLNYVRAVASPGRES